ncbi:hypothetical protein [Propionimicrobium sp. PCR01-08-3]|uniref:hypothetical protein n=1 Tax=Propionimicrobium sp. PCR01-08-3 TaxID=3052086 RepID=UPI00255C64C1|nr:hypothetical protein [Propionimicrobium sp. PCR01-08-3]WIY82827.1 hypothetical protein QQ658_00230 [Propionimicrobium sp. PCR01-08-3]
MFVYLSEMAGLGLVGFDPLGAIIMLSFIAGGARFVHTVVFTVLNWVLIVVLGVTAGTALVPVIAELPHWLQLVPRWAWIVAEIVCAVALTTWAVVRMRTGASSHHSVGQRLHPRDAWVTRPPSPGCGDLGDLKHGSPGPSAEAGSAVGPTIRTPHWWLLIVISAGIAVAAFADPGYTGAVLAAGSRPVSWQVIGLTLWYLIAMSPLVLLCVASGCGATSKASALLTNWISQSRRPLWVAGTTLIVIVAALLLVDAVLLAASGHFLP